MTLEDRIARLEKENLKQRRTSRFLALFLAAALGMIGAAPGNQTLEAEKILIKDSDGRVRIFLGIGENGPTLEFRTPDQKTELTLRAGEAGPALSLSNAKDGMRAALSATKRLWGLRMTDANGIIRAEVTTSESGGRTIQRNIIIR